MFGDGVCVEDGCWCDWYVGFEICYVVVFGYGECVVLYDVYCVVGVVSLCEVVEGGVERVEKCIGFIFIGGFFLSGGGGCEEC